MKRNVKIFIATAVVLIVGISYQSHVRGRVVRGALVGGALGGKTGLAAGATVGAVTGIGRRAERRNDKDKRNYDNGRRRSRHSRR